MHLISYGSLSADRSIHRPRKENVFPVMIRKNWVGRSVFIFLGLFSFQKSVFYACFMLIGSWEGGKNCRVGIVLSKTLL